MVASSVYDWFQKKENRVFLKKFERVGVAVKRVFVSRKPKKFAGLSFVLTGTLKSMTRGDAKQKIRELGGDVSESVSKKTSFVVAGSDPGSKLDDANRRSVRVVSEKTFLTMIGE